MSDPREEDQARLKRLGRYLKGHLRTTMNYKWQNETDEISILTDANWAGNKGPENRPAGEPFASEAT
eukprot:1772694-Karenia_brevis.AAC.1